MNKTTIIIGFIAVSGLLSACGAGRDVAVTGDVKAASTTTLNGPVRIEIIDRITDGDKVDLVQVDEVLLDAPGKFDATVGLEGKEVVVRAINDSNNDAACSAGEAWAEAQVTIADDDTASIPTLELAVAACPEPAKDQ